MSFSEYEIIPSRKLKCLLPSCQMKTIKIASCLITISLAMVGAGLAEVMTIELKQGRSELVDVLGRDGDKVKVKWLKDGRILSVALDKLSDESRKEVLKKLKKSPSSYPRLDVEVSIGKRRKSKSSSYSKSVEITSKIIVTNVEQNVTCPPCQSNIIFIGQKLSDSSAYVVLSNQSFEIVPTNKGAVFESEPFVTTYYNDSDSSGYKYVGYLVVIADNKNHVIFSKTIHTALKKAISVNSKLIAQMRKYETATYMDKFMKERKNPGYRPTRF